MGERRPVSDIVATGTGLIDISEYIICILYEFPYSGKTDVQTDTKHLMTHFSCWHFIPLQYADTCTVPVSYLFPIH